MLIWYFSNNLDIYEYVGKLPEQHCSVWLFSNPGDNILFLLKFDEARISEWNVYILYSLMDWDNKLHIFLVINLLFEHIGMFFFGTLPLILLQES